MSVYTILKNKEFQDIASRYNIGSFMSSKGISDGITNTNYFLDTTNGKYVLTIFEDIKRSKVIKYLKLMNFFSSEGLCAPEIMLTKSGDILTMVKNKPCSIMKKLSGDTVKKTNTDICRSLGELIGRFHITSSKFKTKINNSRDIIWVEKTLDKIINDVSNNQAKLLMKARKVFIDFFSRQLPIGIIHSDLFRDNVLADKNNITGIIDYYYSFTGPLVYELAVIINDWCVNIDGTINKRKFEALLQSYSSIRKISKSEMKQINNAMVAAALRFYLSRLSDMVFPKVGEITHIKDPYIFENILVQRLNKK